MGGVLTTKQRYSQNLIGFGGRNSGFPNWFLTRVPQPPVPPKLRPHIHEMHLATNINEYDYYDFYHVRTSIIRMLIIRMINFSECVYNG